MFASDRLKFTAMDEMRVAAFPGFGVKFTNHANMRSWMRLRRPDALPLKRKASGPPFQSSPFLRHEPKSQLIAVY